MELSPSRMTFPSLRSRKWVAGWLFILCLLLSAMILLGGAVRLTNSGLSITEWQPLMGVFPPFSEQAWQEVFEKYKQIPEYIQEHAWMSLHDFKFIYWMEWAHRFLGRVIGFVVLLPLLVFSIRGWIGRGLALRLTCLFVLGGLQGFIGWWMVASGLTERVDVSHLRLTVHLGMAFLLLGLTLWTLLDVLHAPGEQVSPALKRMGFFLVICVFFQTLLGGLVAGLRAGLSYNTWPLMDGRFVPDGYGLFKPFWLNFFDNPGAVQFNHRLFAYFLAALIFSLWLITRKRTHAPVRKRGNALFLAMCCQVFLGVLALLHGPQFWPLALLHQGGGIVLFLTSLSLLHAMQGKGGVSVS